MAKTSFLDVDDKGISDLTGIGYFTVLEELECCINELTTLDMSRNVVLRRLDYSVNGLTMLDVRNNASLMELDYGEKLLTTLDVSQNPMRKNFFATTMA